MLRLGILIFDTYHTKKNKKKKKLTSITMNPTNYGKACASIQTTDGTTMAYNPTMNDCGFCYSWWNSGGSPQAAKYCESHYKGKTQPCPQKESESPHRSQAANLNWKNDECSAQYRFAQSMWNGTTDPPTNQYCLTNYKQVDEQECNGLKPCNTFTNQAQCNKGVCEWNGRSCITLTLPYSV